MAAMAGRSLAVLAAAALLAALLAGCSGATNEQIQLLRSEIFAVKQEQRQVRHELTALDSLLGQRTGSLDRFGAGFEADVRQMRERLTVVEQRLRDIEGEIARVKRPGAAAPTGAPSAGGQVAAKPAGDPREAFDTAYRDFTSANYQMAIEGFQDFVQRAPQSSLAPEAYYYIGSSQMALKKYREAIEAFRTVAEKYPDSPQHPDALFKIGDSLIALGDRSRAETYFQTLIQRFPDSNAAALARSRLNR